MILVHNDHILDYIKKRYSVDDMLNLERFLHEYNVFQFAPLSNGLFPASSATDDDHVSGYQHVWVRDNVHIAYALYLAGDTGSAIKMIKSLLAFYKRYENKLTHIIKTGLKPVDPMDRPHIRFDGETLSEVQQKWPHTQNDALGYFLWLTCKLINEQSLEPSEDDLGLILLLLKYFAVIEYWKDEDSGHWEETRKISASSIGTVLAGLYEFSKIRYIYHQTSTSSPTIQTNEIDRLLAYLINSGEESLVQILPHECIQKEKAKHRKYDAALLFLLYPLKLATITHKLENEILACTQEHLLGLIGIHRYLGDSYWCADYKEIFSPADRTDDFSDDMEGRDKYLKPGQEAQWCIFDSIISCIYGTRFKSSMDLSDYTRQCHYFNRSLGQLTREESPWGAMKCPELYYIEKGHYIENDHTPLLWAQANLLQAVIQMKMSAEIFNR